MPATWQALQRECGLPLAEARLLLEAATGRRREWLIAHADEPADAAAAARFGVLAADRASGHPIAYLLGRREFYGRMFEVTPAVLIPRPETELLVQLTLVDLPRDARILELGTGSGIIALSLAAERDDLQVVATDRSDQALAVAACNGARLDAAQPGLAARIAWRPGDWYGALAGPQAFDAIVSNPPYIAEADPHLGQGDLRFEPPQALASGPDGLDALRTIVAAAPAWLRAGGWLLLEHGWDQAPAVRRLMHAAGLRQVSTASDLAGQPRVTRGQRPPGDGPHNR